MSKEETLEEAAITYCYMTFGWPINKEGELKSIPPGQIVPPGFTKHSKVISKAFKAGAKWQAERLYTKNHMFFFSGYLKGSLEKDPAKSVEDIFREWEKNLKPICDEKR